MEIVQCLKDASARYEAGPCQYGLEDNLIPLLGATTTFDGNFKHRCVIIYRVWQFVMVVLTVYSMWISTLVFGFFPTTSVQALRIINYVISGLFLFDLVINLLVAYPDKNSSSLRISMDKSLISCEGAPEFAKRFHDWKVTKRHIQMLFGLILVIPYEAFGFVLNHQLFHLFFVLSRFSYCYRVFGLFARWEKSKICSYRFIRLIKLFLVAIFSIHFTACLGHGLSTYHSDQSKTWTFMAYSGSDIQKKGWLVKYIIATYWSLTTLSTVGYGDMHAANFKEMVILIVAMILNFGLATYILASVTDLLIDGTGRTKKTISAIHDASRFAEQNNLPERLKEQMISHLYLSYRTEGLKQQEILDGLPKAIRSSISHCLYYDVVDKIYLFRGVSRALLNQMVSEMQVEYFSPGQDLLLQNEAAPFLYIMVTGAAEVITHMAGEEQFFREVQTGDVFGEVGIISYVAQPFTVRTKRLSQVLRLDQTSFLRLIHTNVGDRLVIMNNLRQRFKESSNVEMQTIWAKIVHILAQETPDLTLGTMSAAETASGTILGQSVSSSRPYVSRITVSWPEKSDDPGKLVRLPDSLQELRDICQERFGFRPSRISTEKGAEIDDIMLIRDGDHLTLSNNSREDDNVRT